MKSSFTVELKIHCHIFAQFFTDFDDTTTLRMFFEIFFPYLINSWSFIQLIDDNPQLIGLFVACQNSNFKIYLDCLNIYLKILSNFFLTWECYAPTSLRVEKSKLFPTHVLFLVKIKHSYLTMNSFFWGLIKISVF